MRLGQQSESHFEAARESSIACKGFDAMQFKLQGAGMHVMAQESLGQQKCGLAVAWQVMQQQRWKLSCGQECWERSAYGFPRFSPKTHPRYPRHQKKGGHLGHLP